MKHYSWDGNPETEPKYTDEELDEMAEQEADNEERYPTKDDIKRSKEDHEDRRAIAKHWNILK